MKEKQSEEDLLRTSISLLFSRYLEYESGRDLETIGRYFEYLARKLETKGNAIHIPRDIASNFESVCLLLKDRICFYPKPLQTQIETILEHSKLAQIFTILAMLSPQELRRQLLLETLILPLTWIPFLHIGRLDGRNITKSILFDARRDLIRLSQILRYAATIQLLDYDDGEDDLKGHYDPNLVDRTKLLALIGILKMQVSKVSDVQIREKLSSRIEQLELEIKKTRPRWGRVIAGFFILFGFAADLRSISPDAYDAVYKTLNVIIDTLHVEGSVEHRRKPVPLPPSNESPLILSLPPRREDEDG
ncbi:MAG: hypothetical protein HC897_05900 [Thermoanaerobaculia bacterium]|nr:hypothetical protein [Thermoanaerobaculia bacterium]